ncbi:unnamed protein product, partial [Laminaria digitata]
KVRLVDVAAHAGVSRATASLVLRGSSLVADKTKAQVLASMRALGYVYNRAAANLRSQRSQTIGLVVTDITNPFFAELAINIETQLDDANYAVMLSNTLDNLEKQDRLLQAMRGHQVDGLLLCPAEGSAIETIETLKQWQMPFVLVARYIAGSDADYAGADNILGAEMAIDHLVEQGHKRIAFIGGAATSSARSDRLKGYQNALRRHGIPLEPALSITSPVSRDGGFDALSKLFALETPPSAALCYNDVVAFGALLGLQAKNITPGEQFAIVGFDDIADAALVRPALTTVSIQPAAIGRAAIDLLLNRIESPQEKLQQVILPPRVVVRQSSIA